MRYVCACANNFNTQQRSDAARCVLQSTLLDYLSLRGGTVLQIRGCTDCKQTRPGQNKPQQPESTFKHANMRGWR
jgi:hypothetical protein